MGRGLLEQMFGRIARPRGRLQRHVWHASLRKLLFGLEAVDDPNMHDADTNTNADGNSASADANTDGDANAETDADRDADSDTDRHSNGDTDPDLCVGGDIVGTLRP